MAHIFVIIVISTAEKQKKTEILTSSCSNFMVFSSLAIFTVSNCSTLPRFTNPSQDHRDLTNTTGTYSLIAHRVKKRERVIKQNHILAIKMQPIKFIRNPLAALVSHSASDFGHSLAEPRPTLSYAIRRVAKWVYRIHYSLIAFCLVVKILMRFVAAIK